MATLDILSRGRVDVGLGRTGYPYQLTHFGSDLKDTRGMWREYAEVLPKIWTEETVSHQGRYYQISPREVLPKPLQKPHPPLWPACSSEETTRLAADMGLGALRGSEGGPEKVAETLALHNRTVEATEADGRFVNNPNALMGPGYCHESRENVEERGTELMGWYMDQRRARARLVWQDVDPATVPPDYQGYYERDMRLAGGPYPGDPTPLEVVKGRTRACFGTLPTSASSSWSPTEAMGVQQAFFMCAIGPAANEEVMNTIRLVDKYVIPHFAEKEKRTAIAAAANS